MTVNTTITTENLKHPVGRFFSDTGFQFFESADITKQVETIRKHKSFLRRQNKNKCRDIAYRDIPEAKLWENDKTNLKPFIELAINSPDEAKDRLKYWATLTNRFGFNLAYDSLYSLKYGPYLYWMSDDERISIFRVLIDAVDDMTLLKKGGLVENGTIIDYVANWVTKPILQNLPIKKRIEQIVHALSNGKAISWLLFLMLSFMYEHNEVENSLESEDYWLIKDEIEIIKKVTFDRIEVEINSNFYRLANPKYLFLFWRDVGTDVQRAELSNWITSHIEDDENFLAFVSMFSGAVYLDGRKVWRVYTGSLPDYIDLGTVRRRLEKIIEQDNLHKERAEKLAQGVDKGEWIKRTYKSYDRACALNVL